MPKAFVVPDLAEQTIATRCWSRYWLITSIYEYVAPETPDTPRDSYGTISSLILAANFPTLVPPNFCTIHVADGSLEFWCKLGGVAGEGVSGGDGRLDSDASDPSDIAHVVEGRDVTR